MSSEISRYGAGGSGGGAGVIHISPAATPVNAGAASLVSWAHEAKAALELAQAIADTAFCPQQYRGKPHEAAAAMLAGAELGFNPMASLRCFDNIQGVTAPKAITQVAVAQSHGHVIQVVSESATKVVVRGKRRGEDWQELEWTIEQAQALGLAGKSNWKQQPKAMLVARALSAMARRVAADALLGIPYSSEEIRDGDGPAAAELPARVTVAEITGRPEPSSGSVSGPDVATAAQLRTLNGLLRDNGITQKDLALALYADVTGREVAASKALTPAEADTVIARLTEMRDAPVDAEPVDEFPDLPADDLAAEVNEHWAPQGEEPAP
jgi:hypothetical protein